MTVEEEILKCLLCGTAFTYSRAIALMRRGFDRELTKHLARKRLITGRFMKAWFIADRVAKGEIDNKRRIREIQILAGASGNRVGCRKNRETKPTFSCTLSALRRPPHSPIKSTPQSVVSTKRKSRWRKPE